MLSVRRYRMQNPGGMVTGIAMSGSVFCRTVRFARVRRGLVGIALAASAIVAPALRAGTAPVAASSAAATVTGPSPVTMQFALTRTGGDTSYDVWVHYQTVDGTAIAGTDYTAASGAFKLAAGAASACNRCRSRGAGASSPASDKQFTLDLLGAAVGVGPTPDFAAQQTFTPVQPPRGHDGGRERGRQARSDRREIRRHRLGAPQHHRAGRHDAELCHPADFPGSKPYSVTAADVNGDGKPDLIVANDFVSAPSRCSSIPRPGGGGDAELRRPADLRHRQRPYSVTTADVNGDGKPDLIVANNNDNTVSVLLNTTAPGAATPSFASTQTSPPAPPESVTTADVNGDGKPDLIVANVSSNNVSVLLNTTAPGAATPSFAAHADFATGGTPRSVTTADVNGDGKPDLIVAKERHRHARCS